MTSSPGFALQLDGLFLRFTFLRREPANEHLDWTWFEVSMDAGNDVHAAASGPVSLTRRDLSELSELVNQLYEAAADGRSSRTLRWDTYESSIELEFTWWGDSGTASGRLDQDTGGLAFEATFEHVRIERDAVVRMRDELNELLTQTLGS